MRKEGVPVEDHVRKVRFRVDGEADHLPHHLSPREFFALGINTGLGDAGVDELTGVFTVQDGKIPFIPEMVRIGPEGQVGAVVKRAAPETADLPADEGFHTREHRAGGLVRKCGEEDPFRRDAALHETGDAVGQRPRLPASRAGNDQERPPFFEDHAELLRIEFLFEIDHRPFIPSTAPIYPVRCQGHTFT